MARITDQPSRRLILVEGEPLDLTTKEYEVMARLVRSAGTIVTREQLSAGVLTHEFEPHDRSIDMHISNLRRKLGRHGSQIATARGMGYLLRRSPAEGSER